MKVRIQELISFQDWITASTADIWNGINYLATVFLLKDIKISSALDTTVYKTVFFKKTRSLCSQRYQ